MSPSPIRIALSASLLFFATAAVARPQLEIRAGDDVSFKLGILGQFQADTITDPPFDSNTGNLFVRRLRRREPSAGRLASSSGLVRNMPFSCRDRR